MKHLPIALLQASLLTVGVAAFSTAALADEYGRVLSSTPIVQAVTVPRQVCTQQQVVAPQARSGNSTGAGAVIGAVLGGAAGNLLGKGSSNRALATGVGVIGGAVVGNQIEGQGQMQGATSGEIQTVQQCSTQNFVENQVTGYNVAYEYAGKQYSAVMLSDPGQYVRLQIVLMGGTRPPPAAALTQPVTPATYPIR